MIWHATIAGCKSDKRLPGCDRAAFDAWDVQTKRRLGLLAGLSFWTKTNTGGRTVISRHWPHKLCWSWAIWWEPYRGRERDGERTIGVTGGFRSFALHLAVCNFRLSWQDYGDMVACRFKNEAPVVRYPWGGVGGGEKGCLPQSLRKILEDANDD